MIDFRLHHYGLDRPPCQTVNNVCAIVFTEKKCFVRKNLFFVRHIPQLWHSVQKIYFYSTLGCVHLSQTEVRDFEWPIWLSLELLARFRRVLVFSNSLDFRRCSHDQILMKRVL